MELVQSGATVLANDLLMVILHAVLDDPEACSTAIAAVNHHEVVGLWPLDLTFVGFEMVDDDDAADGVCMLGITREGVAVELLDQGAVRTEHIGVSGEESRLLGPITDLTEVGGKALAVGMGYTAWLRTGRDAWECIDAGVRDAATQGGFTRVCATGEHSVTAVGFDGCIAHFDGESWTRIDSPTTRMLCALTRTPDGTLYAGGEAGVLLCGRNGHWETIAHGAEDEVIWSLVWFQGRLLIASSEGLVALEGSRIVAVDVVDGTGQPLLEPGGQGHLVTLDDRLYWVRPSQLLFTRDTVTWEALQPYTNL